MRKLGFIALMALTLPTLISAQSQPVSNASCVQGQNFVPIPFAWEEVSVSTVAIGLTAATYNPTASGFKSIMAFISTETDTIRFRIDGGAPTSSLGHQVAAGGSFIICQASLNKLQMIRSGSSDVDASITYFRQP